MCASIIVLFACPTNAYSGSFCSTLGKLTEHPPAYDQVVSSTEIFSKNDLDPHPASCELSSSSQYVLTCTWQFPYHSPVATDNFRKLQNIIKACVNGSANFTRDQNVNHPDYYEAYYIDFRDHILSVTIKDKIGLQNTFIFLRARSER